MKTKNVFRPDLIDVGSRNSLFREFCRGSGLGDQYIDSSNLTFVIWDYGNDPTNKRQIEEHIKRKINGSGFSAGAETLYISGDRYDYNPETGTYFDKDRIEPECVTDIFGERMVVSDDKIFEYDDQNRLSKVIYLFGDMERVYEYENLPCGGLIACSYSTHGRTEEVTPLNTVIKKDNFTVSFSYIRSLVSVETFYTNNDNERVRLTEYYYFYVRENAKIEKMLTSKLNIEEFEHYLVRNCMYTNDVHESPTYKLRTGRYEEYTEYDDKGLRMLWNPKYNWKRGVSEQKDIITLYNSSTNEAVFSVVSKLDPV